MLAADPVLDEPLSLKRLRAPLGTTCRTRSTLCGVGVFIATLGLYAMTLAATYLVAAIGWKFSFACANGFAIALLFIVGHDACHDALTSSSGLNAVIARIAMLPSLHPYTAWAYSHNGLHHSWTNLKGHDPVYAPLTLDEYQQLSPLRKLIERVERSLVGVGLLYFHTIWWHLEIMPDEQLRRTMRRRGYFNFDRALVMGWLVAHIAVVIWVTCRVVHGSPWDGLSALTFGIAVPFAAWNWLMGFFTYQHHTHPEIPWFDRHEEWSFVRGQLYGTAHVVFPSWLGSLLLNIMEHTAHHVDPLIPLYRLRTSQAMLAECARRHLWTLRGCLSVFSSCKLYDFQQHQWLDFHGMGTSATGLALLAEVHK